MAAFASGMAMTGPLDQSGDGAVSGQVPADFPNSQSTGGLDMDEVMDSLDQGEHPGIEQIKTTYHQDPKPLDQRADTSNLWQPPDAKYQMLKVPSNHPIEKLFSKTCQTLNQHWKIPYWEAIPLEMRAQTPYSLALLLGVRRVASHTKLNYELGQEALVSVWRERVKQPLGVPIDKNAMQIITTRPMDHLTSPDNCEDVIQETNYGLMLQDVPAAIKKGTYLMKRSASLSVPKQPAGTLRGGDRRARKVEEKLTKKERKAKGQEARDAAARQRGHANVFHAPANTKVGKKLRQKQKGKTRDKLTGDKGYKLLQFLQGDNDDGVGMYAADGVAPDAPEGANVAPPNSPEPNSSIQPADLLDRAIRNSSTTRKTAPAQDDPALAVPANRHDRHNADFLSQMFNRVVDMDSQHEMKNKRQQKMLAQAEKRQDKRGVLPVDRIRLAEMPTLYARQGMQLAEEAAEGLGKMGLGRGETNGDGVGDRVKVDRVDGKEGQKVAVVDDDEEL